MKEYRVEEHQEVGHLSDDADKAISCDSDDRRTPQEIAQECFPHLTRRQCDLVVELAQGHQNKVIATNLGISESAIKGCLRVVIAKLCVKNRTQAALLAVCKGVPTQLNRFPITPPESDASF